jgi:hypothetical protein
MITLERTVGAPEYKYGYLNLTTDNGITQGHNFPPPNTPLIIVTEGRRYLASMNTNPNQIWGGLRRWFRDENVYAGDKVRITYDALKETVDGRAVVEISLIQRTEISERIPIATIQEEEQEEERMTEINMQMENDLENFLVENLHLIDKDLKLFQEEQGKSGRQYITEIGEIDLLCKKNNDFVVIELKKGRSSDKVVGQISRYIGWVKDKLANGNNVKGIIIVHDFDIKLKYAVFANPNIELKYYQISIEFVNEQTIIDKTTK